MKTFKTADEFILAQKEWKKELEELRRIILSCKLEETIKWGSPVYTYKGKNIVGLGSFKSYCGLWFFQGALLKDEKKVLMNAQEGLTKAMRQWRFGNFKEIKTSWIKAYVKEAMANAKAGIQIKPAAKKSLIMPEELIRLFNSDKAIQSKFLALPPYKQREYADYISEARRTETREQRMKKIEPMIRKGIGLNDKYRS